MLVILNEFKYSDLFIYAPFVQITDFGANDGLVNTVPERELLDVNHVNTTFPLL